MGISVTGETLQRSVSNKCFSVRKRSDSNKCFICAKAKRQQQQSALTERKSTPRYSDEPKSTLAFE
ncbi:hypothetical protein [Lysinibacillus sp. G4S2]|uniref:hypothetical protein n=1 Tax=Lysinibacillus sp. G4S2 TaxID=3055859 RepID=UPI0025A2F7F2|nr:hypothetical protein [Lysinibacillus sp. G4S2]MDM5246986.1 hypothetical protein [Lysinibacillus sp. G4S2]